VKKIPATKLLRSVRREKPIYPIRGEVFNEKKGRTLDQDVEEKKNVRLEEGIRPAVLS